MGAFVSKPITDKSSVEGKNDFLSYGASSMQGWRISQEDAHNAIVDFDESTCFFAVYDGHGGHEVAEYTAQILPNFIKETECYKNGDLSQALHESFLKFDETLVTPAVLDILKEISGTKDTAGPDSDKEEVDNLCKEASMPLEEVIAKYSEENHKFQSPFIRAKSASCPSGDAGCSSSSTASSSDVVFKFEFNESENEGVDDSEIEEKKVKENTDSSPEMAKLSKHDSPEDTKSQNHSDSLPSVTKLCNGNSPVTDKNSSDSHLVSEGGDKNLVIEDATKKLDKLCDETSNVKTLQSDVETENSTKTDAKVSDLNEQKSLSNSVNGDTNGEIESSIVPSEKGGKGCGHSKGKNIMKKSPTTDETAVPNKPKRLAASKAEEIYKQMQKGEDIDYNSDFDDDDEEDEDEVDPPHDSGEDSEVAEEESDEEEGDEEEDTGDDNEEGEVYVTCEDDDEGQYMESPMSAYEKAAFDSGCTACVTLIKHNELFVGNVGDSRCVVCRDGKAIDMSLDHKPEDEIESDRIYKAGGRVTRDGRVNGGLNLSRALGDHHYKQNKSLSPEEQMISPLPDIKSLKLQKEDTFMVLACDGIWNSMTSQETCDFVSSRLDKGLQPSVICEQLFDFCLAPNTEGDGAGCDNMTCIIVLFNASGDDAATVAAPKRPIGDVLLKDENESENKDKKPKLDIEASS